MMGFYIKVLTFCAIATGCATSYGVRNIVPSSYAYNNAIAQSKDEQLLLNLVRLRYRDTVVFMDISGVTVQHGYTSNLSTNAAFPFSGINQGISSVSPGVEYSETPTVVFAPLKGTEFAKNLLSPISTDTIILLANSGWSIERLLSCCIERLGELSNAPSASGPTPPTLPNNTRFRAAANLLRTLQLEERVYVERGSSNDREGSHLVINAPPGEVCDQLITLLAATSCLMKYNLVEKRGQLGSDELVAQTRTVLGALYALSHAVSVPEAHQAEGMVTSSAVSSPTTSSWGVFLNHQFKVKTSASKPKQAFAKVYYRDNWFWIDDSDLESKTTFNLISFLLALQTAQSSGTSPLLTLPAGR